MPLQRSFLCECGLVNDNANRCACGNEYGLLNLASVLDRDTARNALGFINLETALRKSVVAYRNERLKIDGITEKLDSMLEVRKKA